MNEVIKFCILVVFLDLFISSNAQINVRFDNDCLLANSTEFGRAIMETIGEKATRKLIKNDENIKIAVELDSLGRVSKFTRINLSSINKRDGIQLLSNIRLKKHFYICYADGQDHKDLIIRDLRNDFRRNQNHSVVLLFPGQFHETYLYYKGKASKVNYIIEKLKENKTH
jgi:hypothetical protein